MSNFLSELSENKISLEEGLQRLLIIANKTSNSDLTKWCISELEGYKAFNDLPEYRRVKSRVIYYTGLNGRMQVTNVPLGPGFLKESTLEKIEVIGIFDGIVTVEANGHNDKPLTRDLTSLAGEVYKNTDEGFGGVQCISISQLLPQSMFANVCAKVKTRIINLLCAYDSAKVDIDKLDISSSKAAKLSKENAEVYNAIIINGQSFSFKQKLIKNLFLHILIPLIVAVLASLITFFITKNL